MKTATISVLQLNAVAASETAYEFEYLIDGAETGVFFSVIGGQAKKVTDEVEKMIDAQRRAAAVAEIAARTGGKKDEVAFTPFREDVDFTNRNASLRLTGWRGITETFSPELALEVLANNRDIRIQVMTASDRVGNFIKL